MKQLHRLIHSLSEQEWETLLKFLTHFPNKNEPWKKIIELANILRGTDDENISAKIYSVKLYGKENEDALIRIGQMLRNKILECLTLDANLGDIDKDDMDYVLIHLKKKATQFHCILHTRPITSMAQELLDEIIKQSKEYQFYKILIDHLIFKQQYCLTLGPKIFEELASEIEYYKKYEETHNLAFDYLYKFKLLGHYNPNKNRLPFLKNAILDLKRRYNTYKIKVVLYISKQLELEYYILQKDYKKAKEICLEISDIVQNNKSIYRKQRMGIAYAQLSVCTVYLNRFSESIYHAQKSLEYFAKDSVNYMCSKEYEYYGLFYNSNYKEAGECMKYILIKSPRKELGEFHYAQYSFLLACALFKQNKFSEALNILNNEWEISKDKAGWETGLRVLRIKTNIELEKYDEAGKQTEQLRKFIDYTEKNNTEVNPRNKIISKLLSLADKNSFRFSQLNGKADEHLAALKNKENSWEFFSPELISFHEWFEEKLES